MIDIESLIRTMVEPLIEHPEEFKIDVVEGDKYMEYHLLLHQDDIGRVIGRKGRVIRSIRTIVYSIRQRGEKLSRIIVRDDIHDDVE